MADADAAAAVEDPWQEEKAADGRPRPADMPHLSVEGFEGPLDFLLEMVRRHQLDLGRLSIIPLTDQLVAALEGSLARLERRADWLVMASELLRLRAQLLAPASLQAAEEAAAEVDRRLGQLEELAAMKAAAFWLSARPQLGWDVFARGNQERATPKPQAELFVAFLEATLVMLEGREGQEDEVAPPYRPAIPNLWRVPDALEHIRAVLGHHPQGGDLALFLPPLPAEEPARPLKARAALASTLLAGLELARNGAVEMVQEEIFGAIRLYTRPGANYGA
ncbi:segregation/condensation protein A (plasmid) [Roseomonas sp. OT10]|uniref:segregation and condensation protein A n=1 Tax=Roseomonas cutis TaxID=2897332 RepID=UPI001E508EDA|nr:ScpA family protein [Roseomonas sp. OT10]UFN51571.1 segregation/condensation protein A [Roseomonas sp. OT10]